RRASPYLWSFLFLIILMVPILKRLHRKMEPEREDIYGTYCIDTTKFPGKQAKWQYEHIFFEIFPNDSIYFYETEGERIIRTHTGSIRFHPAYRRPRLIVTMDTAFHITEQNPTLYRTTWDFYYVFDSRLWGNMFFKKGNRELN